MSGLMSADVDDLGSAVVRLRRGGLVEEVPACRVSAAMFHGSDPWRDVRGRGRGRRITRVRTGRRSRAGISFTSRAWSWRLDRLALSGQLYFVFSCCELPVQVLVVGFLRSPVTECRVETLAIIADLDVPGNVLPCFLCVGYAVRCTRSPSPPR